MRNIVIPPNVVISTFSAECVGTHFYTEYAQGSVASAIWPVAAQALFLPFTIYTSMTIVQFSCVNGLAVAGNFDIGVYDINGRLKIATGATAQVGADNLQWTPVAATTIGSGKYYLAMSCSGIVGQYYRVTAAANGVTSTWGMAQMAAAHPLPAIATLATITGNYVPFFGVNNRVMV